MTAAAAALGLAVLAALLDLAAPAATAPSGIHRLLRALPAGALAVGLRLAGAPPLAAAALLAFAVADALALDGREPGVGGWTVALLAQLLLAAALWELATPARLLREPWRAAEALGLAAGGVFLLATGRRPRGELGPLAPVAVGLWVAAAAAAGAQAVASLALPFAAAVALWAGAVALRWSGDASAAGMGRLERGLRSAAALAFAVPLLPLPR